MEKVGKKQWNSNLDIFRNILPPMTLNEIFVATDHERIWLSYLPPISLSCLVLPLPLEKYIRGCRLLHGYCISWNWPARTILIFMWICYWFSRLTSVHFTFLVVYFKKRVSNMIPFFVCYSVRTIYLVKYLYRAKEKKEGSKKERGVEEKDTTFSLASSRSH